MRAIIGVNHLGNQSMASLGSLGTILGYFQQHLDLKRLLISSLLVRLVLICYGEWQDRNFAVKFTDIDYHVFSDAAEHVTEGNSPFLRPTYRYTPLLAIILTPNHYLFFSFGKILFVACDLVVGWLIYHILALQSVSEPLRLVSCALWLFNPLTATVSSRGNAEALLAILVLGSLYFIMCKRVTVSAILYGLAVHMKIFPMVYSLPLFLFLDANYHGITSHSTRPSFCFCISFAKKFLNPLRLRFVFISALTFTLITFLLYLRYGDEFIQEAYLYHITRRDTKHNFSVYFYMLSLIEGTWLSFPVGILAFLPQAVLLLVAALWLYRDITFCCFVQTFTFVTFNKVCTSQYFLWYLCLLPLILPFTQLRLLDGVVMATLWFIGQGLWLAPAYFLEFQGYNTYILIWLAGILFFIINVYVLAMITTHHRFRPTFKNGQLLTTN